MKNRSLLEFAVRNNFTLHSAINVEEQSVTFKFSKGDLKSEYLINVQYDYRGFEYFLENLIVERITEKYKERGFEIIDVAREHKPSRSMSLFRKVIDYGLNMSVEQVYNNTAVKVQIGNDNGMYKTQIPLIKFVKDPEFEEMYIIQDIR